MILLDTDVCIALLRGHRRVIERRRVTTEPAAIAGMTAAELFYGAEKSARPVENRSLVESFILTLPILHTSLPILRLFGQLKAQIERDGHPLPDADLLIAATALAHGNWLITGNTSHFSRIPGLKLDTWLT